ncbi:MAG TPA: tripartite tricarboxylate transporter substrate binding protein [Burkholderiales bacterium]|nr:tripartite tricarboxylate transporter substrate binding protein [Burkholderiales bacterium]
MPSMAQTYPTRPVKLIVPFAPGGSDIAARMLAQKLTEKTGQSFVVDNRGGAAGVLGTDIAAKSPPDGYTLLFCTASHAVTAVYYRKLPFDPINDFAPVSAVGSVPFVLVTHPALPVKSIKEFIALGKARPGQLYYSSPGTGGIGHLANVLFAKKTNIEVTHVPYKGTGPALTALLSGEVQFAMPNLTGALTQVRAGKLKALGVAAAQRSPLAPDLPTMPESGVDLVSGTWYGVLAPHGTPQAVVDLLNRDINGLLKTPELREQLSTRGLVPEIMTAREFGDFVRAEVEKWSGVIRDGRIERE